MGIAAKSLPKRIRDAAGLKLDPKGRAKPPVGPPLVGYVELVLPIDPPTVTHHAKKIVYTGGTARLADSPELVAARAVYERVIPERPGPYFAPVRPPCVLRVTFTFLDLGIEAGVAGPNWHGQKPDLDNQVKLLKDVLALRGYVQDDAQISLEVLAKRTGPKASVRIYLRSLLTANDHGHELPIPADRVLGRVEPFTPSERGQVDPLFREKVLGERPLPGATGGGATSVDPAVGGAPRKG